jgi:PleD family two-component response regulator
MSKQLRLPTLLVVADNPSIRFWMKKHLDPLFFVIPAENRQETIQALSSSLDLIIIDSSMEECDALELCTDIRKMIGTLTPILLITGRLKKSFREKANAAGVTAFLSYPLDLQEIQARIKTAQITSDARDKTAGISKSIGALKQSSSASLKNKIVLNDPALKLLAKAKKERSSVALLLLRIDQFTELEHKEQLFHTLSTFIQNLLRKQDILIPSTDGKLILLLANTTPQSGDKIALRLSEKIKAHPFLKGKILTVSIAVSTLEASEKRFSKMIDAAAKSLKTHSETNLIIHFNEENS